MVQWSLGEERYVMGSRRVDALSGSMVVSMADLPRDMRISSLKMMDRRLMAVIYSF
jgi:hypothetical protein